jgi:hypothetical protein
MDSDTARARGRSRIPQGTADARGRQRMAQYQAQMQATQQKTAQLRALRLAKEALDKQAGKKSGGR